MNFVAALLLLFFREEDAFWYDNNATRLLLFCYLSNGFVQFDCITNRMFVRIMETFLPPDYYSHTMLGVQVDAHVLYSMIAKRFPHIVEHCKSMGV
jgi:hypothetical protein